MKRNEMEYRLEIYPLAVMIKTTALKYLTSTAPFPPIHVGDVIIVLDEPFFANHHEGAIV
jgi:hypothetical protein